MIGKKSVNIVCYETSIICVNGLDNVPSLSILKLEKETPYLYAFYLTKW